MGEGYLEVESTRKIIGIAFKVFNELGYGLKEKTYQHAIEAMFIELGIKYEKEKYGKILFHKRIIGKYFLDFLVADRIAVELKVSNDVYQKDTNQLLNYIKSENLPLGLLLVFSKGGVKIKRLVNTISV